MDEYLSFLRVVEENDFTLLLHSWRKRSDSRVNHSPCSIVSGSYLLYYVPHEKQCIETRVDLSKWSVLRPEVPSDHPLGSDFDTQQGSCDTGIAQGN